jgi:hypothetical protein
MVASNTIVPNTRPLHRPDAGKSADGRVIGNRDRVLLAAWPEAAVAAKSTGAVYTTSSAGSARAGTAR